MVTESMCCVFILINQLNQILGVQKLLLCQYVCPGEERAKSLEISLQEAPHQPRARTSKTEKAWRP